MRFRSIFTLLATTAVLAACADSPTAPSPSLEAEVNDIVFDIGAVPADMPALQDRHVRVPGRDRPKIDRDKLSDAQKACIKDALQAFREANKAALEELRAIHAKAREAKKAGATREEIRKIFEAAKPILEKLRPAHQALHEKIEACLK